MRSNAFELFYGGAAGGGKSDFLLIDALGQIGKGDYRAILFRRTFPELEKSLILRSHELYPSQGGKYNEQKHRWTFPSGALIDFAYLDSDKAVFNYQSAQYAYIGFDEATHFTKFQIIYMASRCRCANQDVKKYMRYTSNPGNIGHKFFYEKFIKDRKPYEIHTDELGLTYQFIPAKVQDNRVLMEGDPLYVQRLSKLPEDQRLMLLEGDWNTQAIKGTYYGDLILKMRQEGRITDVPIDKFLPVSVWMDLGMDDTFTMLFEQRLGAQSRLVDSYQMSGMGLDHYVDIMRERKYSYQTIWLPHDAQVRELGTGKTRLEVIRSLMPGVDVQLVPRLVQGSGREVQEGINAMRMALNTVWMDKMRCAPVIEAWESYRHEWNEELQTYMPKPLHDWSSHFADCGRYWAVTNQLNLDGLSSNRQGGIMGGSVLDLSALEPRHADEI